MRERKGYSERKKEEKVEEKREISGCWRTGLGGCVTGRWRGETAVIITALLQLHKRSSVWNQARAASFCFRKQHFVSGTDKE